LPTKKNQGKRNSTTIEDKKKRKDEDVIFRINMKIQIINITMKIYMPMFVKMGDWWDDQTILEATTTLFKEFANVFDFSNHAPKGILKEYGYLKSCNRRHD